MDRLPDWETRLSALLAGAKTRAHAYGEWDCMMLAAAVVEAVTGEDHGSAHLGKYDSAASAGRYLKKLGFGSAGEMKRSILPDRAVAKARRGDLVESDAGAIGVCIGDRAAFAGEEEGREGLVTLPRKRWARAWSVGDV